MDGVPTAGFLWREWEKARLAETSGDCRWDGCEDCGACIDPPGNDLASPSAEIAVEEALEGRSRSEEDSGVLPERTTGEPGPRDLTHRYLACFAVTGRGRFLGHLDRVEAFRRAVRRAGGHLALSQGMRPKALLSLALPLGVGIEGLEELCEFELVEEPEGDFEARLARALPGHIQLRGLARCEKGPRLGTRVVAAAYQVTFTASRQGAGGEGADAGPSGRARLRSISRRP